MLEKVVNIAPGSDYRRSAGNPKQFKRMMTFSFEHTSGNDSISISPATSLLSVFGWKVKKLKKNSDKIELDFELEDFLFEVILSAFQINQIPVIDYKITKQLSGFTTELIVTLFLEAPVNAIENNTPVKLDGLNRFIEQFNSVSIKKPNIITDGYVIESLFIDYQKMLTKEFNYINSCLIQFLEKLMMFKYSSNRRTNVGKSLMIKSIQIR
ncbi:hypothetical protein APF79_13010 [bacterium BRH_c32]|nr:MAG: hypothetical protein APF79_13010 [bacterium BRH_c32]